MEESDDKPFQCTTPGCGQRFANNDHLERHKQKHQLTLKFGSLKGTDLTVADQTPTPTRFLRNCEEEGLFQDLDNPFDQDFKRAADQRLKEQLKMNQAAQSNNIIHRAMTEAVDMVTSQHNGLPVSPANHINHQQTTVITHNSPQDTKKMSGASKRPRRTQDELDPDERRKRFLERNRAAATRCREKRKIWVQQLEKKADDLSNTNAHLQSEITLLRTEVAQLKSLLLAHKDCPVTIAQQRNAQMLNHQVGEQTNGVHTNNSHGTDAASAEDVATSALTQMAHRATLELENLAATTMSSVITTNTNPIGV